MATPAPKTSEIHETLTAYIDAGQVLPEWEAAKVKREIRALDNPVAKVMLTALCHGAMGQEEDAIAAFEDGMARFYDIRIGGNFSTYLRRIGRFADYVKVAFSLADKYEEPEIVKDAWETAQVICDVNRISSLAQKLRKYYPDEQGATIMTTSETFSRMLKGFEVDFGVKDLDINGLAMACVSVASQYRVFIRGSGVRTGDGLVMMCFELDSCDPEQLADMNLDLAMRLAENDRLMDLPVTAWFRGKSE
ncbi:TPA: hypothetical protein ACW7Y0_000612 [Aeromonas hydrophila]|uniref:hypothetical protein n=1 Tax=Aeromonas sp. 1805 TaxID=2560028 RepID=UPI00209C489C|nr:hypothetical protein [Aeromonas sp. 1805]